MEGVGVVWHTAVPSLGGQATHVYSLLQMERRRALDQRRLFHRTDIAHNCVLREHFQMCEECNGSGKGGVHEFCEQCLRVLVLQHMNIQAQRCWGGP